MRRSSGGCPQPGTVRTESLWGVAAVVHLTLYQMVKSFEEVLAGLSCHW